MGVGSPVETGGPFFRYRMNAPSAGVNLRRRIADSTITGNQRIHNGTESGSAVDRSHL